MRLPVLPARGGVASGLVTGMLAALVAAPGPVGASPPGAAVAAVHHPSATDVRPAGLAAVSRAATRPDVAGATAATSGTSATSATSTAGPTPAAAPPDPSAGQDDPAGWTDARLAAQLVVAGVDMGRLERATPWVRAGLGGVALFGSPPADLGPRLAALRAAGQVTPLIASDEEGGRVQRLTRLLGALPSAERLGRERSPEQVRRLAYGYGVRMRALGVDLDLAPVADLAVPDHYVERLDRGFSADPSTVGSFVVGWQEGMRAGHVATSVKHWPGHGQASGDTHQGAATTPPLSVLERRDLLPFRRSVAAGVPAVMVGHLTVPGLTEPRTPASLSTSALAYLRREAGPATLVLTDSLSMRAVTAALGITPAQASVRALRAGADVALVDSVDPLPVVDAIRAALASGALPRERAVTSARRVLSVKALVAAPAVASAPSAVALGDGSALTAWTDPTGAVQVRRVRDGVWGRTTPLGGPGVGGPALARVGSAVVLASRSPTGAVRTRTWRGGAWSPWSSTGATGADAPGLAGLPDGRLALATRRSDGQVLLRLTLPGGGWGPDSEVLRSTTAPALAATRDELVVAGRDGGGRAVVRSGLATGWQPPVVLDGTVVGAPSLSVDPGDSRIVLAAAGSDRRVRLRSRTAEGWQPWVDLGGTVTAAPVVVVVVPGVAVAVTRAGAYADLHVRSATGGRADGPWRRWS